MVKSIAGFYGLINTDGKIIVQPSYAAIEDFGKIRKDWAEVKTVAGTIGCINISSEIVV
ncbi:WG repeat-containing protein [Flavobacterium sp. I3-2]|uniref:WG repeat-containing protein n=1 Tax=Flavobacterium sp. I3-2 TaxID=2748319 RepID=UPI0015AC1A75|nr:WG repeat-containing protein [Flavobacterium sp. I3-2]